jgi:alanine-synthesizing transaminase
VFSSRLDWDLRPNALSELLRLKRETGARVLDLTESNPTRAGFEYPPEILGALADPKGLVYEPSPAGLPAAREAVAADYYAGRVDPSRILLTASTSEAYALLLKLLADPGDELLVPRPSYPLFEFLAALESVRIVPYPLVYDHGWSIDLDALAAAVTDRTRALALVNPNNPTGSFVKRAELDALAALCAERELAILSDEVFADYAFAPDSARVERLTGVEPALTFCLSGLSKIAGLPQMKLGWIVAGGRGWQAARERLELIADTYLSVATPIQLAAGAMLRAGAEVRRRIQERTRRNLDALDASRAGSAIGVLRVEGGWYATLQLPLIQSSEDWALALLKQRDVLAQPGYFFDFDREALLVVSLLTPEGEFAEGIGRIRALVERAG